MNLGYVVRDANHVTPQEIEVYKENGFEAVYPAPFKEVFFVRRRTK